MKYPVNVFCQIQSDAERLIRGDLSVETSAGDTTLADVGPE